MCKYYLKPDTIDHKYFRKKDKNSFKIGLVIANQMSISVFYMIAFQIS